MNYTGKRFSILGDSISTHYAVTGDDPYLFYTKTRCRIGGLAGPEDTWWMRLITALGGVFDTDNALSGTCVTDGYGVGPGAVTPGRVNALGSPDVICIFMGGNDMGFQVPEAEFAAAYRLLLARLKERYPGAEIWCATLINGVKVTDRPYFMGKDPAVALEPFSSHIRAAAREQGCRVADLAAADLLYKTIDGCHPTNEGMAQLSQLWVQAMTGPEEA